MRVVLLRLSALGDIVHAWPLADALATAQPDIHLTWVVEQPLRPLVEHHPAVDATLVCVMRDVSRMQNVTRTTRRLEAAGATIAGTVFSGVSPRSYASRYGDYHYALSDETNA